jgi:hypothetical protein
MDSMELGLTTGFVVFDIIKKIFVIYLVAHILRGRFVVPTYINIHIEVYF